MKTVNGLDDSEMPFNDYGRQEAEGEMTKLTQELAVKLEQGRDLRQWHSMAN